jgi:hypothetical protein
MIRHQHERMHLTANILGVLTQPVQIKKIILIRHKTDLAIIAALNEVQRNPRQH